MIECSDTEEVDALIVLEPRADSQLLVRHSAAPVVQTAAVAAGGLVAGALIARLLDRRGPRAIARRSRRRIGARKRAKPAALPEIVASRSLLVDIHLLGTSGRTR